MIELAEEYLKQFWSIFPKRRLPNTLMEAMPSLLLLFSATEISLKAFLVRDNKTYEPIHDLAKLHDKLEADQTKEIEHHFNKSKINLPVIAIGDSPPKVKNILKLYSLPPSSAGCVYTDTKYLSEPTTILPRTSSLHGQNILKSGTPYPVFLPYIAQALIEAYDVFSGQNQLRKLGADIQRGSNWPGVGQHGEWGLIPASLKLVVVMVDQANGIGSGTGEVSRFTEFKKSYPSNFVIDDSHGGNTLLFYRDDSLSFQDGKALIGKLECRIWSRNRLALHARDLYLLAIALESANGRGFSHISRDDVAMKAE